MIQARELVIDSGTSVTDIFKLVDLPYKITNKSKVTVLPDPTWRQGTAMSPLILRIEWLVERGDPEV